MTTSGTNPRAGTDQQRSTGQSKLAVVGISGAGVLMVLCCLLGPLLLAGGALGILGAIAGNPLVIATAVIVAASATILIARRTRARRGEDCCPPPVRKR